MQVASFDATRTKKNWIVWIAYLSKIVLVLYAEKSHPKNPHSKTQLSFSYFKSIQPIGWQKASQLDLKSSLWGLNSQPTDYQSTIITITPKSQLWMGEA